MNLTPVTRNIIILNVIVYIIANFLATDWAYQLLSAYYPFSPNFEIWQVFTHMFMHAGIGDGIGITHILFNMLTLASFGPILERILGENKYIMLYFLSGIGAFVLFNLWNFYVVNDTATLLEQMGIDTTEIFRMSSFHYSGDYDEVAIKNEEQLALVGQLLQELRTPMVGASGAIFGVMAAFATLFPDARLMFMFVPFPIKAKYILPIIILVSLYLGFSGSMSGVAHFAHIGGAVVGFLMARSWKKNQFRYQ